MIRVFQPEQEEARMSPIRKTISSKALWQGESEMVKISKTSKQLECESTGGEEEVGVGRGQP